jgi:hypothetical protein
MGKRLMGHPRRRWLSQALDIKKRGKSWPEIERKEL